VPELLRASHIKPWALCATDEERLDVFNGLLLAPHLDALFDGGWVTFSSSGAMLVSQSMHQDAMDTLGLQTDLGIQELSSAHQSYLEFHRHRVWRDAA